MPSPFHQKYSTQSHRIFGDNTAPSMPEGPKQDNERRTSDSSIGSGPSSPNERRKSSVANRFTALEALKRPVDDASTNRRSSLQDSYKKPGIIGSVWNSYTRGPSGQQQQQPKSEQRDTTTLRQ